MRFKGKISQRPLPLIGMIHLAPTPGYPNSPGIQQLVDRACADLQVLEKNGYDGVLVENEHDQPHQVKASPEVVASMTRVTAEVVRQATRLAVGVEILLHDPPASLATAYVAGAGFVRTDYFVDRMSRPEYGGEMHLDPKGWLAYRRSIGADEIEILADLQVKYATSLEPGKTLSESAQQARDAGADGVIISGRKTGEAPHVDDLRETLEALSHDEIPLRVWIGSGLFPENAADILPHSAGAIVGTGIISGRRIDSDKAARLAEVRSRIEG